MSFKESNYGPYSESEAPSVLRHSMITRACGEKLCLELIKEAGSGCCASQWKWKTVPYCGVETLKSLEVILYDEEMVVIRT